MIGWPDDHAPGPPISFRQATKIRIIAKENNKTVSRSDAIGASTFFMALIIGITPVPGVVHRFISRVFPGIIRRAFRLKADGLNKSLERGQLLIDRGAGAGHLEVPGQVVLLPGEHHDHHPFQPGFHALG